MKMDIYIGTKMIKAEKATYGEYRKEKYGDSPYDSNMDDNTEGYKVQYSDDYTSWSPKEVFEVAYKNINGEFKIVNHDLITNDNTIIFSDEISYKAPHNYIIQNTHNGNLLVGIHFQEGPLKENELNGIFMEDLIAICINRLDHFQNSEYKCDENEEARNCLIGSLKALRKRTESRKERNVLGTNKV
jgi:hypothetical protein